MADPGLNSLLKWSIQNSQAAQYGTDSPRLEEAARGLSADALQQLMGGPSDADLMKANMAAIHSPEIDLENKLVAFDNFEQLIENLDNANNMQALGLWMPLVAVLDSPEPELQVYAAWCIGTSVQNNVAAQDRCLAVGAVPKLVQLALHGATTALRRKAVYALSSESRNFQPGLDELIKHLPAEFRGEDKLDATDMAAVDVVIDRLRGHASISST